MSFEILIGFIVTGLMLLAAAFGLGHIRGGIRAEKKADRRRIEEATAVKIIAAEHRIDAMKEANDVQQDIKRLSDSDIDIELHDQWSRPNSC